MKRKPFAEKPKVVRVLLWVAFGLMVAADLFLIVEACIPAAQSAKQSDAIGGAIAGIVDREDTDYTDVVEPTGFSFEKPDSLSFKVGDSYTLKGTVSPSNSSYTAVNYSSSNTSVAEVSADGIVSFLSEGEATVTGSLERNPDLKDSLSFSVSPVLAESISISIRGNNLEQEDGTYTLTLGNSYYLSSSFTPSNVTDKSLSYKTDRESFISISDTGSISPISVTEEAISLWAESSNGVKSNVLNLKIDYPSSIKPTEIPLESLSMGTSSASAPSISVNSSIYLSSSSYYRPVYSPSDTTEKGVSYSISDTSIASISGSTLKAISPGEVELTMASTENPSLSVSKTIQVKQVDFASSQPSARLRLGNSSSASILEGKKSYVRYSGLSPSDASGLLGKYVLYQSSDASIAKIGTTNGYLEAIKEGKATITAHFYNLKDDFNEDKAIKTYAKAAISLSLEVSVSPLGELDSFSYSFDDAICEEPIALEKLNEGSENVLAILHSGKDYASFSSYFDNPKAYDSSNNALSGSYSLALENLNLHDANGNAVSFSYVDDTFSTDYMGLSYLDASLSLYRDGARTGLYEEVRFACIPETKVMDDTAKASSSSIQIDGESYPLLEGASASIRAGETHEVTIEGFQAGYEWEIVGNESLYQIKERTSSSLSIYGAAGGEVSVIARPIISAQPSDIFAKAFTVDIEEIKATSISLSMKDRSTGETIPLEEDDAGNISIKNIPVGHSYSLSVTLSPKEITSSKLSISSSDSSIVSVSGDILSAKSPGRSSILVKDSVSGLEKSIAISTRNISYFDQEQPYTIARITSSLGDDNPKLNEDGSISLRNGISYRIKTNFDEASTYTKCVYSSSDEEVFAVSQGGVITPKKVGKATLSCSVNDGFGVDISYTLEIEILRTSAINDFKSFLLRIRKSLGHFGAFVFVAFAATPFFMVGFDKKKWIWSIPLVLLHGFFIAGLTELIQLWIPNRAGLWSDVGIDMLGYTAGFLFAAMIVLISYLGIYLHKRKIAKKMATENNQIDSSVSDENLNSDSIESKEENVVSDNEEKDDRDT